MLGMLCKQDKQPLQLPTATSATPVAHRSCALPPQSGRDQRCRAAAAHRLPLVRRQSAAPHRCRWAPHRPPPEWNRQESKVCWWMVRQQNNVGCCSTYVSLGSSSPSMKLQIRPTQQAHHNGEARPVQHSVFAGQEEQRRAGADACGREERNTEQRSKLLEGGHGLSWGTGRESRQASGCCLCWRTLCSPCGMSPLPNRCRRPLAWEGAWALAQLARCLLVLVLPRVSIQQRGQGAVTLDIVACRADGWKTHIWQAYSSVGRGPSCSVLLPAGRRVLARVASRGRAEGRVLSKHSGSMQ